MRYKVRLWHAIFVTPNQLEGNLKQVVVEQARQELIGHSDDRFGTVVAIERILSVSEGLFTETRAGLVRFFVEAVLITEKYSAGEQIDAVVESSNQSGIMLKADFGLRIVVPLDQVPPFYLPDSGSNDLSVPRIRKGIRARSQVWCSDYTRGRPGVVATMLSDGLGPLEPSYPEEWRVQ